MSSNSSPLSDNDHESSLRQALASIHSPKASALGTISRRHSSSNDPIMKAPVPNRSLPSFDFPLPSLPFGPNASLGRQSSLQGPFCHNDHNVDNSPKAELDQAFSYSHHGVRQDYILGEKARSSSHMIPGSIGMVSLLKTRDFVFVKRHDGSWTYAILALRSFQDSNEEYMMFVLNGMGSTKTIKKKHWGDLIRFVARQ